MGAVHLGFGPDLDVCWLTVGATSRRLVRASGKAIASLGADRVGSRVELFVAARVAAPRHNARAVEVVNCQAPLGVTRDVNVAVGVDLKRLLCAAVARYKRDVIVAVGVGRNHNAVSPVLQRPRRARLGECPPVVQSRGRAFIGFQSGRSQTQTHRVRRTPSVGQPLFFSRIETVFSTGPV